ncbi:GNAT family N-acetyltransferase [Paenibacillus turicensis]|uniref:GNAT family N-acetyltransferase n=1 Tax=Paenibacillus turicensis TaxID=160487 RepID=UPI003D29C2F4
MELDTELGMGLQFNKTTHYPRGLIFDLLQDAYSFDARYEQHWSTNWREADNFMFDNPIIAEKYSFVTTLDGEPIGFIVWDPRNLPTYAELGHNCIRSLHKGKEYGKRQLREAVRRISEAGAKKIIVTTNEGLIPAQRNYEHIGFQLIRKRINEDNPDCAGQYMDYELQTNSNNNYV